MTTNRNSLIIRGFRLNGDVVRKRLERLGISQSALVEQSENWNPSSRQRFVDLGGNPREFRIGKWALSKAIRYRPISAKSCLFLMAVLECEWGQIRHEDELRSPLSERLRQQGYGEWLSTLVHRELPRAGLSLAKPPLGSRLEFNVRVAGEDDRCIAIQRISVQKELSIPVEDIRSWMRERIPTIPLVGERQGGLVFVLDWIDAALRIEGLSQAPSALSFTDMEDAIEGSQAIRLARGDPALRQNIDRFADTVRRYVLSWNSITFDRPSAQSVRFADVIHDVSLIAENPLGDALFDCIGQVEVNRQVDRLRLIDGLHRFGIEFANSTERASPTQLAGACVQQLTQLGLVIRDEEEFLPKLAYWGQHFRKSPAKSPPTRELIEANCAVSDYLNFTFRPRPMQRFCASVTHHFGRMLHTLSPDYALDPIYRLYHEIQRGRCSVDCVSHLMYGMYATRNCADSTNLRDLERVTEVIRKCQVPVERHLDDYGKRWLDGIIHFNEARLGNDDSFRKIIDELDNESLVDADLPALWYYYEIGDKSSEVLTSRFSQNMEYRNGGRFRDLREFDVRKRERMEKRLRAKFRPPRWTPGPHSVRPES